MVTNIKPFDHSHLEEVAAMIQQGEIIAFPTDTVYGLGCDVFNRHAVERIYAIKERPTNMALPVLIADIADLPLVVREVSALAEAIGQIGWPGALTLILPAQAALPSSIVPQTSTVAIRIPNHDLLRDLIRASRRPLVGTSANIHSKPSPTKAQEVYEQLNGRISLILDGGISGSNQSSTIIDLSQTSPRILRRGSFDLNRLSHLLPKAMINESESH